MRVKFAWRCFAKDVLKFAKVNSHKVVLFKVAKLFQTLLHPICIPSTWIYCFLIVVSSHFKFFNIFLSKFKSEKYWFCLIPKFIFCMLIIHKPITYSWYKLEGKSENSKAHKCNWNIVFSEIFLKLETRIHTSSFYRTIGFFSKNVFNADNYIVQNLALSENPYFCYTAPYCHQSVTL